MGQFKKIKILIVEDSLVFQQVLKRALSSDPTLEVVGFAKDPYEARDKIIDLKPDLLTLDIEMPKMNGIEFLQKLIPQYPIPVIVVSSASKRVFDVLQAGAIDYVAKPSWDRKGDMESFKNELINRIKIASTAKIGISTKRDNKGYVSSLRVMTNNSKIVIAIGASTGGTDAIHDIITKFPVDMPGIVVVQHMPPVFTKMYAERLNGISNLEVKEAVSGDVIRPGRVLIAPGDFQMKVIRERDNYLVSCYKGEKVSGHCPSVDVLFDSVADKVGENAIGVILTGMGSDGARGLRNIRDKGGFTIGQDEKSSVVYGMPMVAFNIGAVERELPLERIPQTIIEYLARGVGKDVK
ncbi:protein-glutamate methylesterase/protein-glutamine glutaminase [Clostridium cylindrosporum]|uniref:Protein-glutamate methylesterase/protein-glutamine glutaminase n=1 Tax=Clostridium cylindrosporum DSM 605 TaxID=1121307 RepID=A0A0J8D4C3_CLOCY|nr:chemotaxis response regulator protein-glutamate methylesterase [Clostridium cylindrosporum]KMT21005.1 chemotaxis response regulator protein-glutamate methylesterase 2 [Clostridium cylindrosporum DSM 605]